MAKCVVKLDMLKTINENSEKCNKYVKLAANFKKKQLQ